MKTHCQLSRHPRNPSGAVVACACGALATLAVLFCGCQSPSHQEAGRQTTPRLVYPLTLATNTVDHYFGTAVPDPYRWLEDDNSPATKAWVNAQNAVTFGYLEEIPERAGIRERLIQLWNYERYGLPFKRGDRYFFTRNNGLQNQSVLYRMTGLNGTPEVLLDPNTLSEDGTVALTGFTVTDDGTRLAYGLARAGSDWQEWHVRDVETGQDHAEVVQWVKFSSASWTKDGAGFFYSRYDEPTAGDRLKGANYFHKLYYHRIGTPQSEDELVYHRPDQKEWGFYGRVTDDGRYLIISVSQGTDTRNRVFYRDLADPGATTVELLNAFDAGYDFVGNVDRTFYFRTDLNAPMGRILAIDIHQPDPTHWRAVVPESADRLVSANTLNRQLVVNYLRDATSAVKFFNLDGAFVRELSLPGLGSAGGFGGRLEDTETFYSYTSFTTPGTVYRHDFNTDTSAVFREPTVGFNPADYETRQVFVRGKDGTRIPLFITHKKGLTLNGRNPTYLYGYGGFDISLTPAFSVANLVWMEKGGVYAAANLRGGGEYGESWHQAGMKLKKQTVFDDFIATAEWLIAHNYTSPTKLAIGGGSNGGLLVGAAMTQRPGLFAAALPAVGVLDMLRFHKFTIGWAWTSEYGSSENPDEFKALLAYSPLHNLEPGTVYPATFITTADHDDRVVPAHSFKFAAALQAAHAGDAPVLIRIETRAGHGAGKPVTKTIDETADRWAFLVRELRMNLP
jgi:prolyl oligopeptidase